MWVKYFALLTHLQGMWPCSGILVIDPTRVAPVKFCYCQWVRVLLYWGVLLVGSWVGKRGVKSRVTQNWGARRDTSTPHRSLESGKLRAATAVGNCSCPHWVNHHADPKTPHTHTLPKFFPVNQLWGHHMCYASTTYTVYRTTEEQPKLPAFFPYGSERENIFSERKRL